MNGWDLFLVSHHVLSPVLTIPVWLLLHQPGRYLYRTVGPGFPAQRFRIAATSSGSGIERIAPLRVVTM